MPAQFPPRLAALLHRPFPGHIQCLLAEIAYLYSTDPKVVSAALIDAVDDGAERLSLFSATRHRYTCSAATRAATGFRTSASRHGPSRPGSDHHPCLATRGTRRSHRSPAVVGRHPAELCVDPTAGSTPDAEDSMPSRRLSARG